MINLLNGYFLEQSFNIYRSYFLRNLILESLTTGHKTESEITDHIIVKTCHRNDDPHWKTALDYVATEIKSLNNLGFIQKSNDVWALTEVGSRVTQTAFLHSLASNAFLTYKSLSSTFWCLIIALIAITLSSAALIMQFFF